MAAFAQSGRQSARESGLACAWRAEKFDDHIRTSFCGPFGIANEAGLFMISYCVP
jgi:hypothetical protein